MNLGTLKTATAVLLLFIAGVFLAFLAYLLSMYLFVPHRIFWVGKHSGISYTNAFISILSTFSLNLPLSLHLIATVSILYLAPGSLPITPGRLGIVEGGLIPVFLYLGLSDVIGFFYPFIMEGLRYGKAQSCTDQ